MSHLHLFRTCRVLAGLVCILSVTACDHFRSGTTYVDSERLGSFSEALVTSADVRVAMVSPIHEGSMPGRISPREIRCIEPSPDIAKAVSSSVDLSSSLGLDGLPSGVSADLAVALTMSRAESVAQMTERLATIQLLRDGLYRACEAYANGAITDTIYAVLLSRYDDTMVTLLMGELAAGNFGRSLATLGGSGSGGANASMAVLERDAQAAKAAEKSLEEAKAKVTEKETATDVAQSAYDAKVSAAPPGTDLSGTPEAQTLTTAKSELQSARNQVKYLEEAHDRLLSAAAHSAVNAFATAAGGLTPFTRAPEVAKDVAKALEEMQTNYLHNINSDALMVACISTLDDPAPANSAVLDPLFRSLGEANANYVRLVSSLDEEQKLASAANQQQIARAKNIVELRSLELAQAAAKQNNMTPLAQYCLSGLMPEVVAGNADLLNILKSRAMLGSDVRSLNEAMKAVTNAMQIISDGQALIVPINSNKENGNTTAEGLVR